MEKVDVVIVGAGLAGLATAYFLADAGLDVLVVERGDYSGSKNVTGGRLYLNPVRNLFPDGFWDQAPLERHVVKERLTMAGEAASTSVELVSERFSRKPYHSYTILRSKFDRWFAENVKQRGGLIIPKNRVDDLIYRNGRVAGIVAGEAQIQADVVVAADGALSLIAERAGLRGRHRPKDLAVGIKEIIELPKQTIEERFNLGDREGVAQLFFGSLTKGVMGGGFLYTNLESISLGLVVSIKALMEREPQLQAPELMEEFKERPEVRNLIAGGEAVEYSAHLVPEGGLRAVPKLYADGILLVGDAAGFALNTGLAVRGMDFALASGAIAAQAIKRALEKGDLSAATLSDYEAMLKESFVLQDLHTFRNAPDFLDNQRLFNLYPQVVCDLLERLLWIDEGPKERLSSTVFKEMKGKLLRFALVKDLVRVRRM